MFLFQLGVVCSGFREKPLPGSFVMPELLQPIHRTIESLQPQTKVLLDSLEAILYSFVRLENETPNGSNHQLHVGHALPLVSILAIVQQWIRNKVYKKWLVSLEGQNRIRPGRHSFILLASKHQTQPQLSRKW